MFDDVAVNSSVEHVVRGIAIDTGEVAWCVEFDAGAIEFLGGVAAAGTVVGALVLEQTTGEDVSDVDDAASDAVSIGIGIPPAQADALERSGCQCPATTRSFGKTTSLVSLLRWSPDQPSRSLSYWTRPEAPESSLGRRTRS